MMVLRPLAEARHTRLRVDPSHERGRRSLAGSKVRRSRVAPVAVEAHPLASSEGRSPERRAQATRRNAPAPASRPAPAGRQRCCRDSRRGNRERSGPALRRVAPRRPLPSQSTGRGRHRYRRALRRAQWQAEPAPAREAHRRTGRASGCTPTPPALAADRYRSWLPTGISDETLTRSPCQCNVQRERLDQRHARV